MRLGGLSYQAGTENRYRYNGKELHRELGLGWYDYGFRWYDPAIARFVSVDPLAEKFPELTTYQYASNTPIQAIDLDGLEAYFIHGTNGKRDDLIENSGNLIGEIESTFGHSGDLSNDIKVFGWSGSNNTKARKDAGQILANTVLENREGFENEPVLFPYAATRFG